MGSKSRTLADLFLHTLKDVTYAGKHAGKTLSRLAKAAQSDDLRQALEAHREEMHAQSDRLEQIFERLGKKVHAIPCEAMQGIIEEAREVIDEFEDSPALDAALIAAAQAIEHYEIARYGALKNWARQLGYHDAAELLEVSLAEQVRADQRLGTLAETVNRHAANHPDPAPQA